MERDLANARAAQERARQAAREAARATQADPGAPRPSDEDLGYVTLEAFLASKPVITTEDAGGPTEFVRSGVNGFVARDAAGIAAAIDAYAKDPDLAERHGVTGRATYAETIPSWESVCARLLEGA